MHFLSLAVYLCFSAAALLVTAQNDRSWVEETKNGKKWRNYRINSWVGWQEKSTNLDPDRSTQARNVLIAVFTIINRECFGLRKCHQKRIYFFAVLHAVFISMFIYLRITFFNFQVSLFDKRSSTDFKNKWCRLLWRSMQWIPKLCIELSLHFCTICLEPQPFPAPSQSCQWPIVS